MASFEPDLLNVLLSIHAPELVNEPASLSKRPTPRALTHRNVARGDLHGNSLALLHFLIENSVFELNESSYDDFYRAYYLQGNFSLPEQKERIERAIEQLSLSAEEVKAALIRFVGDELVDRGKNDYFTLLLFNVLDEFEVPFEIYQSNHTLEFHLGYEALIENHKTELFAYRQAKEELAAARLEGLSGPALAALEEAFTRARDAYNHALSDRVITAPVMESPVLTQSLQGLNQYLSAGLISPTELDDLVVTHQKHHKALGYSLTSEGIMLYSHAPIDIALIESLALSFNVPFNDETHSALAESIHRINEHYSRELLSGNLKNLINTQVMAAAAQGLGIDKQAHPLEYLCFNRKYKDVQRLPTHRNYAVHYIHGHDSKMQRNSPSHITCLNSYFGQFDRDKVALTGSQVENRIYHEDGVSLWVYKQALQQLVEEDESYESDDEYSTLSEHSGSSSFWQQKKAEQAAEDKDVQHKEKPRAGQSKN